jgi:hypothetical protein
MAAFDDGAFSTSAFSTSAFSFDGGGGGSSGIFTAFFVTLWRRIVRR